jgi:hypothetical protein
MPSHSSLAKGITWLSLTTFVELEGAAATLPDLHLRKLVGVPPIESHNFRGFSQFVRANTGIIFRLVYDHFYETAVN